MCRGRFSTLVAKEIDNRPCYLICFYNVDDDSIQYYAISSVWGEKGVDSHSGGGSGVFTGDPFCVITVSSPCGYDLLDLLPSDFW